MEQQPDNFGQMAHQCQHGQSAHSPRLSVIQEKGIAFFLTAMEPGAVTTSKAKRPIRAPIRTHRRFHMAKPNIPNSSKHQFFQGEVPFIFESVIHGTTPLPPKKRIPRKNDTVPNMTLMEDARTVRPYVKMKSLWGKEAEDRTYFQGKLYTIEKPMDFFTTTDILLYVSIALMFVSRVVRMIMIRRYWRQNRLNRLTDAQHKTVRRVTLSIAIAALTAAVVSLAISAVKLYGH